MYKRCGWDDNDELVSVHAILKNLLKMPKNFQRGDLSTSHHMENRRLLVGIIRDINLAGHTIED